MLLRWDAMANGAADTGSGPLPAADRTPEVCNYGADLNNDGFEDPMFLWDPTDGSLRVQLFIVSERTTVGPSSAVPPRPSIFATELLDPMSYTPRKKKLNKPKLQLKMIGVFLAISSFAAFSQALLLLQSLMEVGLRIEDTQVANRDLNLDGDTADTFDVGQIMLLRWDAMANGAADTEVALCPPIVLQEVCNYGADLNNDGFEDPMFLWDPTDGSLRVQLFIVSGTHNGRAQLSRTATTIYLRNGAL
ncbi:MAG: hypothetical protein R3F17_08725 [Planctomycetota bacterium]